MLSRRRLLGLALGAGAWALTACVDGLRPTGSPTSRATVQPTPPMTQQPTASAAPRPEPQLADKVAAMLLVGFRGLAIALVVGLVEEGRLDPARIDESWRRIRNLRRGLAGAVAQET